MTRWKAFLTHLGISIIIFLILLYFIIFHWYPGFLFTADGGWQGVRIIAAVDLVLGPLLTLIVFKAGKPSLKFDLSVIALIQASALAWGVWVTYSERPYVIIYSYDFFKPVPKSQLKGNNIAIEKINKISGNNNPRIIYNNLPSDYKDISKLLIKARKSKEPLYMLHEYYSHFTPASIAFMKKESFDLKLILEKDKGLSKTIKEKLNYYSDKNNYLYNLISSRYRTKYIAVFDINTYKIIDTINVNPLKYGYVIKIPKNKSDISH